MASNSSIPRIPDASDLNLTLPDAGILAATEKPIDAESSAPQNPLYRLSWFDAGFASYRRTALKSYIKSMVANLTVLWVSVAIVYGAYYKNNDLGKLKVFVVDFDGGALGTRVVDAFQQSLAQQNHFDLVFGARFTDVADVRYAVYDEQAWAAVFVNDGATENLAHALSVGNTTYDPTSAVEVVSVGARNPLTSNSHVVPGVLAILEPALTDASLNATATFLSDNEQDNTALRTALNCPQCLSSGYSYTQNDLRPAYNATTMGAILSGAIALIVFTFAVAGTSNSIGLLVGEYLNVQSTVAWRLSACIVAYLIIALSVTGVQASFGIPMTTPWGGRGFVILWMLNWLTISAFGFALEAIVTVFGMWICNWFLNFWVFWNSAGASYSAELMPGFYKYSYGFPLVHAIQGTSTIVYGTKSHLSLNFGVLVAWVIGWATMMSLATVVRLRWNMRQGFHRLP